MNIAKDDFDLFLHGFKRHQVSFILLDCLELSTFFHRPSNVLQQISNETNASSKRCRHRDRDKPNCFLYFFCRAAPPLPPKAAAVKKLTIKTSWFVSVVYLVVAVPVILLNLLNPVNWFKQLVAENNSCSKRHSISPRSGRSSYD